MLGIEPATPYLRWMDADARINEVAGEISTNVRHLRLVVAADASADLPTVARNPNSGCERSHAGVRPFGRRTRVPITSSFDNLRDVCQRHVEEISNRLDAGQEFPPMLFLAKGGELDRLELERAAFATAAMQDRLAREVLPATVRRTGADSLALAVGAQRPSLESRIDEEGVVLLVVTDSRDESWWAGLRRSRDGHSRLGPWEPAGYSLFDVFSGPLRRALEEQA
jgi:hypothetical protein